MIEALEGRRFLSATATAVSSAAGIATPALVVKPAILGPSAVEGTYKGSATLSGTGTVIPLKLVIRSTSVTLTVTGYGKATVAISAKTLKKIRSGSFDLSVTADGATIRLNGSVVKKGERITGTFGASGSISASGTFLLKKG
jgi:autotransporter translocation and assembly factor TamB